MPSRRGSSTPWKPTKQALAAAHGKTVADLVAPDLKILFCGINPSLYSAAVGHHFARPGNRFWPVLHAAGFSERRLSPFEERVLLDLGYGITNLVARATTTAAELSAEELLAGDRRLVWKVRRYRPAMVAFLGITAYRLAFDRKQVCFGSQEERIGESGVWLLPNPSGLNAHFQLADLALLFRALRCAVSSSA